MFAQFLRFPPEIQNLIVEQCLPNDKTCLSLTCKYMHSFVPIEEHRLGNVDYTLPDGHPKEEFPLHSLRLHRQRRHATCRRWYGTPYPEGHVICDKAHCRSHCECFTCPLYKRLRTWFPRDLKYCTSCDKFTRRDKRKSLGGGRCLHGRKDPLCNRTQPNFWTYRKGNGFGANKMWKKWYTNTNLKRWSNRQDFDRTPNARYDLRKRTGGAWKFEDMY